MREWAGGSSSGNGSGGAFIAAEDAPSREGVCRQRCTEAAAEAALRKGEAHIRGRGGDGGVAWGVIE